MSPCEFVQSGVAEDLKGAAHAGAAVGCAIFAGYNFAAYGLREQPQLRNLVIGLVYTLAFGWEVKHTLDHWRR